MPPLTVPHVPLNERIHPSCCQLLGHRVDVAVCRMFFAVSGPGAAGNGAGHRNHWLAGVRDTGRLRGDVLELRLTVARSSFRPTMARHPRQAVRLVGAGRTSKSNWERIWAHRSSTSMNGSSCGAFRCGRSLRPVARSLAGVAGKWRRGRCRRVVQRRHAAAGYGYQSGTRSVDGLQRRRAKASSVSAGLVYTRSLWVLLGVMGFAILVTSGLAIGFTRSITSHWDKLCRWLKASPGLT